MSDVIGYHLSKRQDGEYTIHKVWVQVGRLQKIRDLIPDSNWHPRDEDAKIRVIGRWEWLLAEGYNEIFEWTFSDAGGVTLEFQSSLSNPDPFFVDCSFHGRTIKQYKQGIALLRACRMPKRGPYDTFEAIPHNPKELIERIDQYRNVEVMWPEMGMNPRWTDWVVKSSGPIRPDGALARARALPKELAA
jgi:hypothetical protein